MTSASILNNICFHESDYSAARIVITTAEYGPK